MSQIPLSFIPSKRDASVVSSLQQSIQFRNSLLGGRASLRRAASERLAFSAVVPVLSGGDSVGPDGRALR